MSTNFALCTVRESVQERRSMVIEMSRRGMPEWLIAERMRISHRTVQRYKHLERRGIPPRTNRKD